LGSNSRPDSCRLIFWLLKERACLLVLLLLPLESVEGADGEGVEVEEVEEGAAVSNMTCRIPSTDVYHFIDASSDRTVRTRWSSDETLAIGESRGRRLLLLLLLPPFCLLPLLSLVVGDVVYSLHCCGRVCRSELRLYRL